MLAPRAAYSSAVAVAKADARLALQSPRAYILYYVVFLSLLIAASAAFSATGRVTLSQLLSLGVSWMFVPLLQVLIAAGLAASARASKVRGNRAIALLLMGHAPWSLWLIAAAATGAAFGYRAWHPMLIVSLLPAALTFRIVHAFCMEVLGTPARGAMLQTLAHQAVTWLIVVIYLEKAVGLVPRIYAWFS